MSAIAVIDASAAAAVVFHEPDAASVVARVRDAQLVAPRLLEYELAHTAVKKMRRHAESAGLVREGLAGFLADDFDIYWSDVDLQAVFELALDSGLTAYDASYLWLALHLDADLISLDRRLEHEWQSRRMF
jgi:predicted nucleic acid-binding protein